MAIEKELKNPLDKPLREANERIAELERLLAGSGKKDAIDLLIDRINGSIEYREGNHTVCSLLTVKFGRYPEPTFRAWWKLNARDIPRTHTLVQRCGVVGCINLDHLELRPLKKPDPPAPRVASLESVLSMLSEMALTLDLHSASLERLEGKLAASQRPPGCARCRSSDIE